jgi:aspartate-semialdehyde dehydrogenase
MSDAVRRIDVAVVGVTGLVGEALLAELEQREFPVGRLYLLASENSENESRSFANRSYPVGVAADFDFSRCQLAFFCVPADVARTLVPKALDAGCRVIDVSSAFRLQDDVPLEVGDLGGSPLAKLLALPSASVVQAATLLAPLAALATPIRVSMTNLLAVSALGRRAIGELAGQTARLLNAQCFDTGLFPVQIAFNSVPLFDAPTNWDYTDTELQLAEELRKVLRIAELDIAAQQLFAPVFYGQTQILQVTFGAPVALEAVRASLAAAAGVTWLEQGEVLAPVGGCMEGDQVVVGRIRQDDREGLRWTLWSVADNVRKGAAVNSVQVAENLLKSYV